ncbi:MAG: low molecular weight phosphotyrosine protein phosphatase, partial [Clostridia bacterium]|nr:low molecular weight phosphotyrosine protein phosphatase [Clostridia bacterium]
AHQMTRKEYEYYDYVILMDEMNRRWCDRIIGEDDQNKVSLLLEHAGSDRDVADPWYTGNFDKTWDDVNLGCKALLEELSEK